MASLSLKHIYKVYEGTTKAVNDFNMEIRDREFIVFVGPSGCGKSTTLRMIAGLEDISAGELSIDGVVVNDMEPRDRNIAMVFQNYALYPHMTVYENMAFSLKTAHIPKKEIHEKVTEAARILGITEYLERKPRALSGGQRQRVALGRAIVRNPKVFLFDEPLSNLDAKLRAAMRAEIIRLYERLGTTFIYVTHDQVEAMTMGSRIVVMRGGFVQQIDTPKNLYNHPANLFVAGFIGTPRMNFWDGTLQKNSDSVQVHLTAGADFSVSYERLSRVQTRYMDGKHPVTVGVRPDHVCLWSDTLPEGEWAQLAATVSVVEALGGETLIYARLGQDAAGLSADNSASAESAETATPENATAEIILKASAEADVSRGDNIRVAVNLRRLHIFDQETEQALTVRIPRENVCACTVEGNTLVFANQRFVLPPALQTQVKTEKANEKKVPVQGELVLPTDALLLGTGAGCARVVEVERITDTDTSIEHCLYQLSVDDETFFALTSEQDSRYRQGDTVPFDLDFSRLKIETAGFSPLPSENQLSGRFIKEKVTDDREDSPIRGKRMYRFYLEISDQPVEAETALSEKLFSCKGSAIFSMPLTYTLPLAALHAVTDRPTERTFLSGKITNILDYGRNTFLRVALGSQRVIVPSASPSPHSVGDIVFLTVDQSLLSVIDRDADMVIV